MAKKNETPEENVKVPAEEIAEVIGEPAVGKELYFGTNKQY